MKPITLAALGSVVLLCAGQAAAQTAIATEQSTLGRAAITLHLHPFLTEEELVTLRLVATNEQALSLFVLGTAGYAALAVSPEDGFVRDGALVASAVARADLPDAQAASKAAQADCDAVRRGPTPCVVVLEVAPAP